MNLFSEPIVFAPLYQERVWGGRLLESIYQRDLPTTDTPYGEAWEVVDRESEQSVVRSGELTGQTLGDLWNGERDRVFGQAYQASNEARFPLLMKILDARDRLSIQVHPPAALAAGLGGESKTEMWYIAEADEGALLYVGLKKGVTRDLFKTGIEGGKTAELVHAIPVKKGQFIFIPSGRLHAIGAGLVIFEIQQNSDTTYRVFDWNRLGLDGNPRALHVDESLQCIDFSDYEPGMDQAEGDLLVNCPHFQVEKWQLAPGQTREAANGGTFSLITVVSGKPSCAGKTFSPGETFLIPAASTESLRTLCTDEEGAEVLRTTLPIP